MRRLGNAALRAAARHKIGPHTTPARATGLRHPCDVLPHLGWQVLLKPRARPSCFERKVTQVPPLRTLYFCEPRCRARVNQTIALVVCCLGLWVRVPDDGATSHAASNCEVSNLCNFSYRKTTRSSKSRPPGQAVRPFGELLNRYMLSF